MNMAVRGQVERENSSLPVAVRVSKTRLLELAKVKRGSETERDLGGRQYEFSDSECNAFNQGALHHFFPSALRNELHEDVTPSSNVDSNEKGSVVVMFCSDSPVKRYDGDRA